MGTVYLAYDRELRRNVALKVLGEPAAGADAAARMLREARIIAVLEHPGIVPVHDVGTLPDGRIYYAMKRVGGRRLDEEARRERPLPELLRTFEKICDAVAFAHAHGVIHRDLKPANVMLGSFGEVLVMDWGVAKLRRDLGGGDARDDETRDGGAPPARATAQDAGGAERSAEASPEQPAETAHGTILGTPGYMAPEQARGEADSVDERADVYSLGAILHFLLAGTAPGRAAGAADPSVSTRTWQGRGIEGAGPSRPGLPRSVPRALAAVCAKALAERPDGRYSSASELAADVGRFLAGQAVQAHREGPLERLQRFFARYRTPVLLILAYLVLRILLLVIART
jgi:serine/threonine protein kinase